jgi:hypothetical protein
MLTTLFQLNAQNSTTTVALGGVTFVSVAGAATVSVSSAASGAAIPLSAGAVGSATIAAVAGQQANSSQGVTTPNNALGILSVIATSLSGTVTPFVGVTAQLIGVSLASALGVVSKVSSSTVGLIGQSSTTVQSSLQATFDKAIAGVSTNSFDGLLRTDASGILNGVSITPVNGAVSFYNNDANVALTGTALGSLQQSVSAVLAKAVAGSGFGAAEGQLKAALTPLLQGTSTLGSVGQATIATTVRLNGTLLTIYASRISVSVKPDEIDWVIVETLSNQVVCSSFGRTITVEKNAVSTLAEQISNTIVAEVTKQQIISQTPGKELII